MEIGNNGELKELPPAHWQVVLDGKSICYSPTPQELWDAAIEYFRWCDSNPVQKPEMIRSGIHTGKIFAVPIPRPYTMSGLCLHLGLTRAYLMDVAMNQEADPELSMVVNRIIEIAYTQKLEYAITGVYNPIIAMKELGLGGQQDGGASALPSINIEVRTDSPPLLSGEKTIEPRLDEESGRWTDE